MVGTRRKDLDSADMWEIFDLSELLTGWKATGNTYLPEVELDITMTEHSEAIMQYRLSGNNAPLLITWSKKEDLSLLENMGSRNRRSAPPPETPNIPDAGSVYCSIRPWTVHFNDLGWQDFILFPMYYEANFCEGLCPESLNNSQVTATNHAYVKSLIRTMHPARQHLPAAYCVPFTLDPISVVYKTNNTIHVIHRNELVTKTCGCM